MRTHAAFLWPLAAFLVTRTSGSAIPMWEFLSRGEKMSHLFNMFAKQVTDYCDTSSMPDCNKVLLVYGLTNLAKMGDDSLDKMDPYQRGSRTMIWESMMKGGLFTSQTPNKSEPELADPLETGGGNDLGSASNNVEDVATPPGGGYVIGGPMVVRVMPDGRPVPGDSQRPLPKDEDAEEFIAMRSRPMPSMGDMLQGHSRQYQPQRTPPHARPSARPFRYTLKQIPN